MLSVLQLTWFRISSPSTLLCLQFCRSSHPSSPSLITPVGLLILGKIVLGSQFLGEERNRPLFYSLGSYPRYSFRNHPWVRAQETRVCGRLALTEMTRSPPPRSSAGTRGRDRGRQPSASSLAHVFV